MIQLEDICLKDFKYCNYITLIRFIRHIMYALYIPELTGHVQSDGALFINIVTCNIAQYVCDYGEKHAVKLTFN